MGSAAPVLALLSVVSLDLILAARSWPVAVVGLLDEPAHLLTAWLALTAVASARRPLLPWVLLGAVVIDLDHIPYYAWGALNVGTGRPITHSLLTVLTLIATAITVRKGRIVTAGLAAGVLLHLFRDAATGPGVPLLRPFRSETVLIPYWSYLAVLAALTVSATFARVMGTRSTTSAALGEGGHRASPGVDGLRSLRRSRGPVD